MSCASMHEGPAPVPAGTITTSPAGTATRLPAGTATIVRAGIRLAHETCERFLPGCEAVALLLRDGQLLIVPLLSGSAGGLLLKQRNLRGDRVIQAQEFLRQHGLAESDVPRELPLTWNAEAAALTGPANLLY